MAFSWQKEAAREGGQKTPELVAGVQKLKVVRVIRFKKDGTELKSNDGHPQLMVILGDAEGREGGMSVTLSEKAGWVLARLMLAAGANLSRMDEVGVKLERFADEQFASKQLVGRELWAEVTWPEGKKYPEIMPLSPEQAAAAGATALAPASDDNVDPELIPF